MYRNFSSFIKFSLETQPLLGPLLTEDINTAMPAASYTLMVLRSSRLYNYQQALCLYQYRTRPTGLKFMQ